MASVISHHEDAMPEQICAIDYMYRDGSNYKRHGAIYVDAPLSEAERSALKAALDDAEYFLPEQLGLGVEELNVKGLNFPNDDDHPWHEMALPERMATAEEGVTVIPKEEFLKAMLLAAKNGWDDYAASVRLKIPGYPESDERPEA